MVSAFVAILSQFVCRQKSRDRYTLTKILCHFAGLPSIDGVKQSRRAREPFKEKEAVESYRYVCVEALLSGQNRLPNRLVRSERDIWKGLGLLKRRKEVVCRAYVRVQQSSYVFVVEAIQLWSSNCHRHSRARYRTS